MQFNDTDFASDSGDDNRYVLSQVDKFIDLVTTAHIRNNPYQDVFTEDDHMAPWQWLGEYGSVDQSPEQLYDWYFQGGATYGASPTVGSATMPSHCIVVDHDRGTIAFHYDLGMEMTWYLEHGQAWQEQRGQFEGVGALFEKVVSYSPAGFGIPLTQLEQLRSALTPASDITAADVEAASQINIATEDGDIRTQAGGMFTVSDEWSEYTAAATNLAPFQGQAVQLFRAAYLDRLPAILLGQTMTARALEDSLTVLGESYKGLRSESIDLLFQGIDFFHSYTGVPEFSVEIDWGKALSIVSGVASMVAGATAFSPGTQVVSAIAGMVSGAATVAAAVVGSPAHQEAVKAEVRFEGGSPREIYGNFRRMIETYLGQVDNTEQVLRTNLTEFLEVIEDRSYAMTIHTSYGDDVYLTQQEAFFQLKKPEVASIAISDGYSSIATKDMVGPAPKTGEQFSADLNALFKASEIYLPNLAANYRRIAGFDVESGLAAGFTRSADGYNPAVGNYDSASTGPVFGIWTQVMERLYTMLGSSASHLEKSGEALTATAIMYGLQDEVAAAGLDDVYRGLVYDAR